MSVSGDYPIFQNDLVWPDACGTPRNARTETSTDEEQHDQIASVFLQQPLQDHESVGDGSLVRIAHITGTHLISRMRTLDLLFDGNWNSRIGRFCGT